MTVLALVVAGASLLGVGNLYWRSRPRRLEPIASSVGAVLQTLGHKTDIGATVAGARGNGNYQTVANGARVLLGWSLSETAAGTAEVRLHDGNANTAALLTGGITFAANGTSVAWFADEGIEVTSGQILTEVVSGSVRGVLYWA